MLIMGKVKKDEKASKAVATKADAQVPAELMGQMESQAAAGMEGTDTTCFAIPFLRILQSNSPQLDSTDGAYIAGAKIGDLFDTVSKECFDGEEGVLVVACAFKKSFVEWGDRESGGTFVGEYPAESNILTETHKNEKGKDELPNGNTIADTRSHFCIMVHPETGDMRPVVIAMSSTQIKKSRAWLTNMRSIMLDGPNGKFNPPTFGQLFRATSTPEENAKGKWRGWKIESEGFVDPGMYTKGGEFHGQVQAGRARIAYESTEAPTETTEEGPF
jgi:hypothetical protein